MTAARQPDPITRERFDAVLFDMDGVLTDTAGIHAACWKQMFDEFLGTRAARAGEDLRPFDIAGDYLQLVDGKPRDDGVRDFLRARGIELPPGSPQDAPGLASVSALGRRKNELVHAAIAAGQVRTYPSSVALVRRLRARGFGCAVVTSSRNCAALLDAAGIAELFDAAVDGNTIAALGLAGKPAPDAFVQAARSLGVEPARAVVVEDAISGVQAGAAGGFGLVIGVARHGNADALKRHGADIVVADLGELGEPG